MSQMSRRHFLTVAGMGAASLPFLGAAAACSSSSNNSAGGGPQHLKIASGSDTLPPILMKSAGPVLYGSRYGLKIGTKDIVHFDDGPIAIQAAQAGRFQLVDSGILELMISISHGLPFRIFQPYSVTDDFVIAATGDITTISDIKSKNATVGVDSGAGKYAMDAILLGSNAGFLIKDLHKVQDIESSSERTSALAAGQVQVTIIHEGQANSISAQGKHVNILGYLYKTPGVKFIDQGWMAPKSWLDDNLDTATSFCEAVIAGSRDLSAHEDKYLAAAKKLVTEPPSTSELKATWDVIHKYNTWPAKSAGLEPDRIQFMLDLGVKEGVLDKSVKAEDVVDTRPSQAALKKLGPWPG